MTEKSKKSEIEEELKNSNEKVDRENLDKEDEQLIKGGTSSLQVPGDGSAYKCCNEASLESAQ